jgi:hypothetical protein
MPKKSTRNKRILNCIGPASWLLLLLIFTVPVTVYAGDVYGRVMDKTGTFKPGDEVMITGRDPNGNAMSVTAGTDKDGRYKISLPPGTYQVKFSKGNKTFEGRVQSFPQATHQDIVLLPAR